MNYLPENKQAIIVFIENLPGPDWFNRCDTDDRVEAFYLVWNIYRRIAERLKDFFECKEPEEIDIIYEDETLAKLIEDRAEEYQLIYSALLESREDVEAILLMIKTELEFPVNQANLTPLDFLQSICHEDATNMLQDMIFPEYVTGNNYANYSVSRSYKTFLEANKIVRTRKSSKEWEKNIQLYHKRYPKRTLCMDILKASASEYPGSRPCFDHLDKFHGLTLINAPALFHPERVKDYSFSSYTVKNGRVTLKLKRPKES